MQEAAAISCSTNTRLCPHPALTTWPSPHPPKARPSRAHTPSTRRPLLHQHSPSHLPHTLLYLFTSSSTSSHLLTPHILLSLLMYFSHFFPSPHILLPPPHILITPPHTSSYTQPPHTSSHLFIYSSHPFPPLHILLTTPQSSTSSHTHHITSHLLILLNLLTLPHTSSYTPYTFFTPP